MFNKQLKELKIPVNTYLKTAKQRAKNAGYNPSLLTISKSPEHKLNYDGVKYGRTGYGDFIIWRNNPKSPNNLALKINW